MKDGSIHTFFESRAQGRTLHPAPGGKSGESRGNRDSTTLMPLRQHLIIALLRSLQQRAGQIVEAKETDSLYVTSVEKGLILADRSFPFHKWDASTQKLAIDKKTAVSSKKKHEDLMELLEMMQDGELIIRFHALRSPNEQQDHSMRLQLNLRSDRPLKNSVWMTVGASMKQHTASDATCHNLARR